MQLYKQFLYIRYVCSLFLLVCNDTSVGKIIIVEETCEQIPPWLQREMVQCTETEASDGNEADRGSELSDNEECRRREVTSTAANDHVNKATSGKFFILCNCLHCPEPVLYQSCFMYIVCMITPPR